MIYFRVRPTNVGLYNGKADISKSPKKVRNLLNRLSKKRSAGVQRPGLQWPTRMAYRKGSVSVGSGPISRTAHWALCWSHRVSTTNKVDPPPVDAIERCKGTVWEVIGREEG